MQVTQAWGTLFLASKLGGDFSLVLSSPEDPTEALGAELHYQQGCEGFLRVRAQRYSTLAGHKLNVKERNGRVGAIWLLGREDQKADRITPCPGSSKMQDAHV